QLTLGKYPISLSHFFLIPYKNSPSSRCRGTRAQSKTIPATGAPATFHVDKDHPADFTAFSTVEVSPVRAYLPAEPVGIVFAFVVAEVQDCFSSSFSAYQYIA